MNLKMATAFCLLVLGLSVSFGTSEIKADIRSTLRIVFRLCYYPGNHNDTISVAFFDCYAGVDGEHLYKECQKTNFGDHLDTEARINVACYRPYLLFPYARCLKTKFHEADLNLESSALVVNKCQAKVVGIEDIDAVHDIEDIHHD